MPVRNRQRGFALLYSVIITTVVLVMGVSLMNIVTKQLVLSTIARGAKLSYFAAISGNDCANFWKSLGYFGRVNSATGEVDEPPVGVETAQAALGCPDQQNGSTFKIFKFFESEGKARVTEFEVNYPDEFSPTGGLCSHVKVTVDPDESCLSQRIVVESEGYNAPCTSLDTPNPRRVRSIYSDKRSCE